MTIKQKKAIKEIVENHRSVSSAMRIAGYKPTTATVPKNLTQSKTWQEVMKTYRPDEKVFQRHSEALDAEKWNDFSGEREADHAIRLRAAELQYKLTKKIGPEIMQQFNSGDMKIEFVK